MKGYNGSSARTFSPDYDVAPDGQSFVMVELDAEAQPRVIRKVLGWREEVERRLAAAQ